MKWNRQKARSLKDKFALHRQAYHDRYLENTASGFRREDSRSVACKPPGAAKRGTSAAVLTAVLSILPNGGVVWDADCSFGDAPVGRATAVDNPSSGHFFLRATLNVRAGDRHARPRRRRSFFKSGRGVLLAEIFLFATVNSGRQLFSL